MIPLPLPIPLNTLVYFIALHLGLSAGWTLGRGLTLSGRRLPDWSRAVCVLVDEGITQYVVALALITVSSVLMVGAPLEPVLLIILFGMGIGMAYDDRENHPPEGMMKHMFNKFRGVQEEVGSLSDSDE